MATSTPQLALRLSPQAVYTFSNYYFYADQIKDALSHFAETATPDFIYLAGEAAVGKTHLLIATAEAFQQHDRNTAYVSFNELMSTAGPDALQHIESYDLVCFDDLELIVGKQDWEEALFHCFNRLKAAGCQLLIAAKSNPSSLNFSLPDLASRMATGLIFQLAEMTDTEKQHALILQAQAKGLSLDEATAQYLLRRSGRDMHNLIQVLDDLDKASLRAQRRLTIPFIRDVVPEL